MSHPFTPAYMMQGEEEYDRILLEAGKMREPRREIVNSSNGNSVDSSLEVPNEDNAQEEREDQSSDIWRERYSMSTVMAGGPSEPQKLGLCTIFGWAVKRRLTAFANDASVVGLSSLVKPAVSRAGRISRKILWIGLLLFGVGFMSYQIGDRIIYYLSWPTATDYQIAFNETLRFPSVTLCPEIRAGRQLIIDKYGEKFIDLITQFFPPFPDVDFHPDIGNLSSSVYDVNWKDAYIAVAPTLENTVIACEFQKVSCNLNRDFQPFINEFRLCYTFNRETTNYITKHPGNTYGLHLILWTNQTDALVTASPATGFKVFLHDPMENPLMNAIGFRVQVGTSTAIEFSLRNISQLPYPYGDCRDEKGYSFMKCMAKCQSDYIYLHCNCVTDWIASAEQPVCIPEQVIFCSLAYTTLFISSGASRECVCPLQCNQKSYPYSVTSNALSELYLNHTSKLPKFMGRNISTSRLRREIAFVDIFFSRLEYINIQTTPAYDALKLFSDLGGALGVVLGATVLTVCEVFQLVFDLIFLDLRESVQLYVKFRQRNHQRQTEA